MTPAIDALLPVSPIAAIATPLPVIFPTSITGAVTYAKAGEVDRHAAMWMAGDRARRRRPRRARHRVDRPRGSCSWRRRRCSAGSPSASSAARGGPPSTRPPGPRGVRPAVFATIGLTAGVVSGLLGIGGGLVMVPLLSGWCRMPLKRALGTSLLTIPALVIPGTIVHALLGQHRLVGRAVPHDRRGAGGPDRREPGARIRRADAPATRRLRACWPSPSLYAVTQLVGPRSLMAPDGPSHARRYDAARETRARRGSPPRSWRSARS